MRIIVVGCGRVGFGIASALIKKNHEVVMIDSDPVVLKQCEQFPKIECVLGIGYDKETLEKAKINYADGIVCCTAKDSTNALIARIAQVFYRVPKVIARLYDPKNNEVYNRLGIKTVSTTDYGISKSIGLLEMVQLDEVVAFGSQSVKIVRILCPVLLENHPVSEFNHYPEFMVTTIVRENKAFIPTGSTLLKKRDLLILTMLSDSEANLKKVLGIR